MAVKTLKTQFFARLLEKSKLKKNCLDNDNDDEDIMCWEI